MPALIACTSSPKPGASTTNVVWAVLDGLRQLNTVEELASQRGLEVAEVL